jgi:hypothetical protein
MTKNIILILFCIIVFNSCEEIVDNPGLPYKKQLVVKSMLYVGEPIQDIYISKTLPPLEDSVAEKSLIPNAVGYVKCDGVEYPLRYDGSSSYYVANLIPEIGKTYYLDITAEDLHVTSETTIRPLVELDTFFFTSEYVSSNNYSQWHTLVYTGFRPNSSSVYRGLVTKDGYNLNYSYSISRAQDTTKSGLAIIPIYDIWTNYKPQKGDFLFQGLVSVVNIYDSPYYDYFLTRYNGNSNDAIFGTSGVNIKGNINNGIGLFMGVSSVSKAVEIH